MVNDKGALEIADLYRVHLSVNIYIQHTLPQPNYYDGPIEAKVNNVDTINDEERLLAKMY